MREEYDVSQLYKKSPLGSRFWKRVLVPKNAVDVWKVSRSGEKKSRIRVDWATTKHFFVHFFAVTAWLPHFTFYVGRQLATTKISFSDIFFLKIISPIFDKVKELESSRWRLKDWQIHFHGTLSSPSRRRRVLSPVHTYPFFFESGIFFLQLNLAVRSHVSGENGFLVQLKRKSPGPTVRVFFEIFLTWNNV